LVRCRNIFSAIERYRTIRSNLARSFTDSMSNGQPDRAALLKTRALIVAVIVGNVAGNTLLSRGLHHDGSRLSSSFLHYLHAVANPWAISGVIILAAWMIANLSLLSRADLSYALPVTGSMSFMLVALVGHFYLGEPVSAVHWIGIAVITVGVVLVIETSPLTVEVHGPPEDEI
jgi:drug/metabolite transporter (DMT)-like permease